MDKTREKIPHEETKRDPTNRIVCVFDDSDQAVAAMTALEEHGYSEEEIQILKGDKAAGQIDDSPKWFADTDEDMHQFRRYLEGGKTLVSVPVYDKAHREEVHDIVKAHGAWRITHFGQWVTEVLE